jgi:hypothetical protein
LVIRGLFFGRQRAPKIALRRLGVPYSGGKYPVLWSSTVDAVFYQPSTERPVVTCGLPRNAARYHSRFPHSAIPSPVGCLKALAAALAGHPCQAHSSGRNKPGTAAEWLIRRRGQLDTHRTCYGILGVQATCHPPIRTKRRRSASSPCSCVPPRLRAAAAQTTEGGGEDCRRRIPSA